MVEGQIVLDIGFERTLAIWISCHLLNVEVGDTCTVKDKICPENNPLMKVIFSGKKLLRNEYNETSKTGFSTTGQVV